MTAVEQATPLLIPVTIPDEYVDAAVSFLRGLEVNTDDSRNA